MHDGIKWIWKTSEELADRFGCNEKTIRRHLKGLVEMGWLKREQLQKRWGMRAYHYSLGDDAPLKLNGYVAQPVEHLHGMQEVRSSGAVEHPAFNRLVQQPRPPLPQSGALPGSALASQKPLQTRRFDRSEADTMSGSINRNTTSTNSLPGQNSQRNSQGASRQTEQFHQAGDLQTHNPKVRNSKPLAFKTRAINHSTTESQTSKQQDIKKRESRIRTRGASIEEGGIGTLNDVATTGISKRSDLYKHQVAELVDALVSGTSAAPKVPSHWPDEDMSLSLKVQVIEAARQLAFPGRRAASYGSC